MSIQCLHPAYNYHFEGFAQTLAIPLFFIVTQRENFITLHYESRFAFCVPNLKASNEFPV